MVNFWIFQNRPDEKYADELDRWSYYKDNKKWLFSNRAPRVRDVKPGDRVVLRIFGRGFSGKFTVTSSHEPDSSLSQKDLGWIKIDDIQLWNPPLPRNLVAEQLSTKQYRHAIIQIEEKDYILIESCQRFYKKLGLGSSPGKNIIVLEKGIEKALIPNLEKLGLKLYKAHARNGKQFGMDSAGRCDLLCLDEKGCLVVIEIKRAKETGAEVVGQCLKYMGYAKKAIASKNQKVRGIIVTGGYTPDIEYALEALPKGLIETKIFRLPI